MPKQTYKIENFHGGLNNNADPRDIKDEQFPESENVKITKFGQIKTLGKTGTGSNLSNNTLNLVNRGLFVMGSDRKVSNNAESNETLIFAYDTNDNKIDIKDSSSWTDNAISLNTTHPVYYSADGIARVGDGTFTNKGRWFGYKATTFFQTSTSADLAQDGWIDVDQEIVAPTNGKCLISTPHSGSDTNGVNSSNSEYIGNVIDGSGSPDDVVDTNAINLRVGFQFRSNRVESNSGYGNGGGITSIADSTTHYPLFGNNNLLITGSASTSTLTNGNSLTLTEEKNILFGMYLEQAEYNKFTNLVFRYNETSSGDTLEWEFSKEDIIPDCWNVLSLSSSNATGGDASGVGLDTWNLEVNGTSSLNYFFSGILIANNPSLEGYSEGLYSFHYTYLYDEAKQESLPLILGNVTNNVGQVNIIGNPILFNFDIYCCPYNSSGSSYDFNKRISGARIYYKREENDNYYLIGELDIDNTTFSNQGFTWFPESTLPAYTFTNTSDTTGNVLGKTALIKGISPTNANSVDTFKSLNGYDSSIPTIECKYKTAVVHGRRVYIGNIKQNSIIHSDRMIKSRVNKFDTFPSNLGVVDVAIRDGESIIKLEAFADRILQFKQKSLYIINVSENVDFLEDVYRNKGCEFDYHVTKTDYGITWFNKFGVYLYDGKSVSNLLEKDGVRLINESDWESFITSNDADMSESHIGYIPKRRQILIKNNDNDVFLYDLVLRAWTKGISNISIRASSSGMTNFALDEDQDLFYLNDDASAGGSNTIYKNTWNNSSQTQGNFLYRTKDIDFGQPGVKKKIYKVYITYKGASGASTYVDIKYDVNGATTFDKTFKDTTNFTSNVLSTPSTTDWTVIELIPSTTSEANNIYSFALKMQDDATGFSVPRQFSINDITIVFRIKNVE